MNDNLNNIDEKQIIEGNYLIAEFLGWKFKKKTPWWDFWGYMSDVYVAEADIAINADNLPFHDNYNWAMLLIQKIERCGYEINIQIREGITKVYIDKPKDGKKAYEVVASTQGKDMQHTIWLAIIEFVKWSNENKKS